MKSTEESGKRSRQDPSERELRVDAQRSVDLVVAAAKYLFTTSGVQVTTREIAERAGVGMGTLYRRFPRRADLIATVFEKEMDACAEAAATLAQQNPPFVALSRWVQLYVEFMGTKKGLAKAVSSDDPVYIGMYAKFDERLLPAIRNLCAAAVASGEVKPDLDAHEFFSAISTLCMSTYEGRPDHASRMVAILVDGLRMRC